MLERWSCGFLENYVSKTGQEVLYANHLEMSFRKVFLNYQFSLEILQNIFVSKTLSCGKIIFLVRGSLISYLFPFKRQLQKMVKPTEAICRVLPTKLFECVWKFCGVDTERINVTLVGFTFFLCFRLCPCSLTKQRNHKLLLRFSSQWALNFNKLFRSYVIELHVLLRLFLSRVSVLKHISVV